MKEKTNYILLPLVMIAIFVSSCGKQHENMKQASFVIEDNKPLKQDQSNGKSADQSLLIGEWTRTDAPYQIKITDVLDNGKLDAAYFNPRSIYVSKAYWTETGTILTIYVELQDENYPGSNYKLNYNSERNVLVGEYFQAVEGVTYPVEFVKTK